MRERKLFTRRDLCLFGGLLALCALLLLLRGRSPKGAVAVIEKDGQAVLRRELSALSAPEQIVVRGENGLALTVSLSPEGAQVTEAGCPDQICVRTGKLEKAGQTAVCLPAKVSVRLEGSGGADAETY